MGYGVGDMCTRYGLWEVLSLFKLSIVIIPSSYIVLLIKPLHHVCVCHLATVHCMTLAGNGTTFHTVRVSSLNHMYPALVYCLGLCFLHRVWWC